MNDCKETAPGPKRLDVSARLREHMRYDKFSGPAPRVLILQSRYWLDAACRRAAERLGWEVRMAPVVQEGTMPRAMLAGLLEALTTFRPDFVLTVNLSGMDEYGMLAGLLGDLEVPCVTWFVDDPRTIIMDRNWYAAPHAVALTWEASYVEYLQGVGFPQVHVMPLAADTEVFNATPASSHEVACSFVGSSMRGYAQQEWAWAEQRPALAQALHEALAEGRVTREHFGQGMHTILGNALWARCDSEERRHLELITFIEGTKRLREDLVRSLAPEGLVVRGDTGWQDVTEVAGPPVPYEDELPAWYRRCAVNLNTTSIQMATAVNQRVFDAPAAGGFVLTDAQATMGELFEEGEYVAYRDAEECRELLRFYLKNEAARKQVVVKARERVLAEHTYERRMREIVRLLR